MKLGSELERRSRAGSIGEYRVDVEAEENSEDVVVYVPDNGMGVDGDE